MVVEPELCWPRLVPQITLFGESAGAGAVSVHLVSPVSRCSPSLPKPLVEEPTQDQTLIMLGQTVSIYYSASSLGCTGWVSHTLGSLVPGL